VYQVSGKPLLLRHKVFTRTYTVTILVVGIARIYKIEKNLTCNCYLTKKDKN
jgi:cell division protein FtsL